MISEQQLIDIAKEYGTPTYIFDIDELEIRMNKLKETLGKDVDLCYAMKANPFLTAPMKNMADKFEVCSPGEFAICEREKIDMKSIVLSGVNKEKHDIEYVFDECGGVGIYTVESFNQFELLSECAAKRKIKISVLLRITSGNQFGMDEELVESIISKHKEYEYLDIRGIQCYTGTQKKKLEHIEKEIDWLDSFLEGMKQKYNYEAKELEYGPGLPVSYFKPDLDNENFEMLEQFVAKINPLKEKYKITLEMGRYIAATCGIYISRIADMKINKEQRYCIIDGGINHVNYYGQTMAMKIPQVKFVDMYNEKTVKFNEEDDKWNICGSLCTVGDVLIKNFPLAKPKLGDMLVFYNIGAYSVTEGIYLFLSRKLPKILLYENNKIELVRQDFPTDIINSKELLKY